MPVLFIKTTPGCGAKIRSRCNMNSKEGGYYDPGSSGKYLSLSIIPWNNF